MNKNYTVIFPWRMSSFNANLQPSNLYSIWYNSSESWRHYDNYQINWCNSEYVLDRFSNKLCLAKTVFCLYFIYYRYRTKHMLDLDLPSVSILIPFTIGSY